MGALQQQNHSTMPLSHSIVHITGQELYHQIPVSYNLHNYTAIHYYSFVLATHDSSDDNSDKKLLTLLCVFSVVTITLLLVFTVLVVAVIWTKRHRSKVNNQALNYITSDQLLACCYYQNYPVSPFLGTISTTTTSAKSNYYSGSPEISAVNKVTVQPAVALHITPRLQSVSSAETDSVV